MIKIHTTSIFLAILQIMMTLAPVIILSNDAFAQIQTLHNRTLYEVVKQTSGSDENSHIDVGDTPWAMELVEDFDLFLDTLYVVNVDSDSVSVISAENNTKIGEDIPVGDYPVDILSYGNILIGYNTLYVVNYDSDSVSVISAENNTKIGEDIPVGEGPEGIFADLHSDSVYVANADSNDVSVISAENNTKIGEDIPVGEGPTAIAQVSDFSSPFPFRDRLYVVNHGSNDVSVISAENNTKIGEDIPVGDYPVDILSLNTTLYVVNDDSHSVSVISAENNTKIGEDILLRERKATSIGGGGLFEEYLIAYFNNILYVVNYDYNIVSVISAENNTKIGEDIPVGEGPTAIVVDYDSDSVYVANAASNSLSVIDPIVNEVVAGITFKVNPFNSGYILCDGLTTPFPTEQYIYVYSGAQCTAKPNKGFEFLSWEENLEGNSTQLITVSSSASTWDSILDLLGFESNEPEATLNVTKFGTFTANFKELPPAVPSEYWIPIYGILISTIVGWSIPSIIGWAKSKADVRKLNYYHKRIASLYGDGKLDENDIEALDRLRSNIMDAYSKGKINEKHYESLRNEISILYEEILRKRINALNKSNPSNRKTTQEQLAQIRNEVEYAYSKGKINEKHYDLLNKNISNLDGKDNESS
jgi:YVTN family beta-propeller protein